MTRLRAIFFGTPDFAIYPLKGLLQCNTIDLVGLFSQPDRPSGRGHKVQATPTKGYLAENGYEKIPVFQPTTLKKGTPDGDQAFADFKALSPDFALVAAYGRIIPKRFLNWPARRFLNVHGSLLPRWRGAAPIQRAIQHGDLQTGIALMDMIYELDAGDVYTMDHLEIRSNDTSQTLFHRLGELSIEMLQRDLSGILSGEILRKPQDFAGINYAHRLEKSEAFVSFLLNAVAFESHSRAFHPWPGVKVRSKDTDYKIKSVSALTQTEVEELDLPNNFKPGTLVHENRLIVGCQNGYIEIGEIQKPGKAMVKTEDFMRQRHLVKGDSFEVFPIHNNSIL